MQRMPSFHQNSFEPRNAPVYKGFNADLDGGINVDDVLLTRNEQSSFGKFQFLGLALVFGAVGLVTQYNGSGMTQSLAQNFNLNTGKGMRSGGRVTVDSCAIGDESCDDDNLYYGNQEVDTF